MTFNWPKSWTCLWATALFFTLISLTSPVWASESSPPVVTLDPAIQFQTMDGWGGNIYPYSFEFSKTDPTFLDKAFKELKTTHMRLRGFMFYREYINDNDDPESIDWKVIDKNPHPTYVREHLLLKEMQSRGIKLLFAAFRTPYWLIGKPATWKPTGKDKHVISRKFEPEFVESIAIMLLYGKRYYGVTYDAVSLANEPFSGGYIKMGPAQLARVTKQLKKRLERENYKTKIYGPEPWTMLVNETQTYLRLLAKEKTVDALAFHSYRRHSVPLKTFASLAKTYQLPVWVTEYSDLATSPSVAVGHSWPVVIKNAHCIMDLVNLSNASLMIQWCYASGDANGMSHYNPDTKSWSPGHDMLKHFHNHIPPGSKRIAVMGMPSPLMACAFMRPDKSSVTHVALNLSGAPVSFKPIVKGHDSSIREVRVSNAAKQYKLIKDTGESISVPASGIVTVDLLLK